MTLSTHEPLYLKYRPQALARLVGQSAVSRTLTNAIEHDRLSHAYLFTGPRGTGKTSTARILAKSLNCEQGPTPNPCQKCTACLEIAAGISPAVFELDAASNNSVDDARILIERAPLVAVGGRFKIYIIDECHMLTKEAFNALLKTIEEPPPAVIFVLATTEEHKVPSTIVSRCQRLMFRLVSQDDLCPYLREVSNQEQIKIDDEALNLIARRSGGGMRDALGLLDQASLLSAPGQSVSVNDLLALMGSVHEDVLIEISGHVLSRRGQDVLALVNKLLMEGREPAVLALELARHFLNLTKASYLVESDQLVAETVKMLIVGSSGYISALCKQSPRFDRAELSQMVEQLDRLEQTCRRTTQPAMSLEMGLLALCHRHDMVLVRELTHRIDQLETALSSNMGMMPARAASSRPDSVRDSSSVVQEPGSNQGAIVQPQVQLSNENIALAEPFTQPTVLSEKAYDSPVTESIPQVDDHPHDLGEVLPAQGSEAAAAADQSETGAFDDRSINQEELQEFWQQLLSDLEKRHLPSFSLVSTQAFPVGLSQKELLVGVLKENWKKIVEGKSEHIRIGCEAILGHKVIVKVKVVSQSVPVSKQDSAVKPKVAASVGSGYGGKPEQVGMKQPHDAMQHDPVLSSDSSLPVDAENDDGLLTAEAYKIFEGPGSRQIG